MFAKPLMFCHEKLFGGGILRNKINKFLFDFVAVYVCTHSPLSRHSSRTVCPMKAVRGGGVLYTNRVSAGADLLESLTVYRGGKEKAH